MDILSPRGAAAEEAEDDPLDRLKRAATRRGGIVPKDMLLDTVIGATEERATVEIENRLPTGAFGDQA
jgi:hypothetical protein